MGIPRSSRALPSSQRQVRKTKLKNNDGGPGEITSETVKSRSYYGDHVMGPAVRSQFHMKSFAAAISFCVDEDIDLLSESFVVTVWDINPPQVFLNTKDYIAFQADVKARSQAPSFSVGNKVPPNAKPGNLFKPTELQLYVKISLIVNAHPQVYLPLSEDKLTQLRDCLQTELNWDINIDCLRKLFLSRLRFRSMGSAAIALPTRKANGDKEKDVPWTEDEKKDYAAKQKLMRKRLAAPKPTLADKLNAFANFKQVEDTKAEISFHEDHNDRSFMRLRVTHMYKNGSRPKDQPSFKTDVDLAYSNTRPLEKGSKPEMDRYDPSHRIINVSDRSFIPFLEKIFPQLAGKDKDYWNKCYTSLEGGHDLVLLQFRQNMEPMTINLFVDRDDIPTSYKGLQTVMRSAPCIFVLVRGTDVKEITDSIIHRFSELAVFDPLSAFFVDKNNPYINDKGIKATPSLPKFTTLPENSSEDWAELSMQCGVGAIIELRLNMQDHTHRGKASAHPVPHTQFKYKPKKSDKSKSDKSKSGESKPDKSKPDNETSLDLCLFLNFTEERPDKEVPRLAIGDFVTVDLGNYYSAVTSEHRWSGRVVAPALSTGMGQVCMIINRPIHKNNEILDKAPYTELTVAKMENMSVEEIQQWSSDNQVLKVTLPNLQGKTNEALLDQYLREFRTEYVGVTDKRYKSVEGSLAWIILQLAHVEGFPVTKEVANTWNEAERDVIATKLRDIPKVHRDITTEDKMSDQSYKDVKAAFRIGYHIVIEKAAVVCTTLSVATKSSFQIYRKANAVTFEAAGRGTDLDVTALLSTHWACDPITLVGDWRQLGFTTYEPVLDNPFQSQLTVSPFARFYYTRFPIESLTHTSQFRNPALLKLCAHLNSETVFEVPGSFNKAKEEQAQEVNRKIWGRKSVFVVVNTEHAVATRETSGSWYNVVTAIATMHDMIDRLRTIDGDDLLFITAYNGQLRLLRTFRDTAVRNALAVDDKKLAKQLTKVMMITIDSSMGKDRQHVIMDSGQKDPLKEMLYRWNKDGLIVTLDRISTASFEQYRDAQVPTINPEAGTDNFEADADGTWNNGEPTVNPEAGADNFETDDKSDGPASPFVEEKSELGAEDEETWFFDGSYWGNMEVVD
ncbi:hypothetical protein PTMSG1_02340 [Pyrenophora teres f. maculata]|nr:hypothetical protein PTMSG1_02340 [Pyrenophora teres f. maculata]